MKLRKLILAAALVAGSAWAQQNYDISGKEFLSGAGDARFATIGRQAAASGKRLVVTAPQQWHKRIAAKIRAGGKADIVLKDGFYESVLVRIEDKPAEPPPKPKPEPRPEPKPEPKPAPAPPKPAPRPAAAAPQPAPQPKPVAPAPQPAPRAEPPRPAPAPAQAKPEPAAPAKPDVGAIEKRMEGSLNNGREAEGPISVGALQPGDYIFVDGPVRAVIRRESLRPRMFWLQGELDLRRTELKELGANRYQVMQPVRGDIVSLRDDRGAESKELHASVPADNAPARARFERDFNEGRTISDRVVPEKLRSGDFVYTGKDIAVVVRRDGAALRRYWLDGTLDLTQAGLKKDGANKYRVLSDTVH